MKYLRHTLALGCMSAWIWLILHGYAETEFTVYSNEFGRLLHMLPSAALTLALIACLAPQAGMDKILLRLWTPAIFCMMLPVLMSIEVNILAPQFFDIPIDMLAGAGFAVCFVVLGRDIIKLPPQGLALVAGGGMLASSILVAIMLLLPQRSLSIMAFILTVIIKLLIPSPKSTTYGPTELPRLSVMLMCALLYGLAGLSKSIYYSLLAVIAPWFSDQLFCTLLVPGAGCLFALLCIQLSARSVMGKSLFLCVPILLMGYMAWPLLHRESSGLSLLTLSFTYAILDVFGYLALFFALSRFEEPQRLRLLAGGAAAMIAGLWIGSFALSPLRTTLSQGITTNYLFAALAVTLFGISLAFMFILEYTGFWRALRHKKGQASGQHVSATKTPPWEEEADPTYAGSLPTERCVSVLREMELTRQQALIATCIAQKRSETEICAALNISQSTLKTHVRNILKRLGLNSRYEIAWLLVHTLQKQEHELDGDAA